MKTSNTLYGIAICCIGIVIGFFSHDGIRNIFSHGECCKKESGKTALRIKSTPPDGATALDKLVTAHSYSYKYRQAAGYCPEASGKVTVDAKTLGFMDLGYDNAVDLKNSMEEVRKIFPTGKEPSRFRLISGVMPGTVGDSSILIVVPLKYDATSKKNIELTDYIVDGEATTFLRILDNKLDCPIKCDYSASKVILYPSTASRLNACK